MTRVLTVLALALILLLTMSAGSFARVTPYPESEEPGGDDHPWGGEYTISDPSSNDYTTIESSVYTGIFVVDLLFNEVLLSDKLRTVTYTTSTTTTTETYIEKGQVSRSRSYIGRYSTCRKGNR